MAIDPNNPFADLPDAHTDPFADLPDAQQGESGIMPALGAGIDKMQELGYRAVKGFTDVGVPQEEQTNALGRAIGQGGALSRWADEGIQRNIEEQKAYTPTVESYKDIDSIGDAASYVGEMTAQSVPMMAAAMNPIGLFTMGGGMSNEAYEAQPEDNKQPWRATASGFGQAGLERLGVESSIGRVLGGEGKNVIKRVGQSALGEGVTETGQEALAQWGTGKSIDEIENLDEAFVGGAAVGGTIRTGTEAGKAAYDKYRGEKPALSDFEETDLTQSVTSESTDIPDPFADIGPAQESSASANQIEVIPGETAGDTQPNWQFGQNDMPYRGQVTPYTFTGEYEQYRETPSSVPVGAALEAPVIDGEFERPRGLPNRADTIIGEDGRPMQQAQEFADSVGQASNRALPFDDVIYAEDKRNVQVKRNGQPFGGRRAAQITKEFRQAKEQGLNPQVIKVNGGYGWVTDGEKQSAMPEVKPQNEQPTITTKPAQKREAPKKSTRSKVYTPNGRELEVEYAIVDADQLVTSNTDDGRVNPDYPQTLQPRDRTRASSEIQINSIANNLNPALLGESATTGDGAPIISDSGIVESGNGRSLALKRAYQNGKADKYRSALIEQGYDVSGVEKPVLARVRRTQLNDEDLVNYTKESNERSTLSLSASETAKADGNAISNIISGFKGGDVSAAGNRDFVRKFMQGAVSQSEQASMIDSQGMLSQDGRRRIEAAMIANAYENSELVNDLFESSDNDIKSIGGALLDASGDWAKMRAAKKAGATQEDVDITPNVIDAVNLVRRSRAEGKKLSEMVSQTDIFAGDIDPTTKVVLGLFYGGDNFTKPRSRQRVKEALTRYAELASSTNGGDDLFGGELETVKPEQLLGQANAINEQTDQQAEAQTSLLDQNPEPAGQSSTGDRGEGQRPAASGNGQASAESEVKESKEPPKSGFLTPEETQSDNDLTIEQVMDLGPAIAGAGGNAGAGFGIGNLVAKQARDVADKIQSDMREGLTYKEALEKARKSDDFGAEQFEKIARQAYPNKVTEIDAAANEAATSPTNNLPEPTEAQKEAGNYKKGKVRLHGLYISIENPKGSTRKGKDQDGKEWSSEMKHHYGDIKGTTGADGDSIDVFIGDKPESQKVFVVDQIDPKTGEFDEVKVMMGFDDAETAKSGYLSNYDKNWKGLGEITEASVEDFKAWTKRPRKSKQPFALPVKPKKEEAVAKDQEDWGKKITTARKNISVRWNENSTDEEISSKPLSKTWPEKEFDDVGDTYASAFAFAARGEIPRKPSQSYKKQRWVEKVKNYRQLVKDNVVDGLLTGKITKEKMKELGGKRNLQDFFAKVDLLSELDRKDWGKVERVLSYPDSMDFNPKTEKLDIPNPKTYVRINGRNREFNSTDPKVLAEQIKPFLEEKVEKPQMKFEVRGRKGSYSINKKGDPEYTRLATFDSSKEAFDFIKNNNSKLVESWESHKARVNVTKADIRNKVNKPRTGEDYRNGKNATAEDFQNTFGIKRGTFGKWVKQGKERQDMLNGTYDALMDLANITGVPPRALSLEGKLGFAFGANGRGKAMAHYEPGEVVINLTKTKGAGSLAHEWFHALDNYFQKKRDTLPTTEKGNFITHNPETYYIGPRGYSVPESRFRDMRGINKNEWRRVEGVRPEVATSFKNLVDTLNGLDFAKRSSRLDKGKAGGYWSSNLEMAARAFESYVKAKMSANGYDNDFLANVTSDTDFVRDDNRYPYIKADEIAEVEAAFDDLFNTIESKESDNGDVALFRQGDGPTKTKVKVDGKLFETGKPVTFPYLHNKDSATKMFGIPDKESPFGRGFEPSAKYVTYHDGDKPSYGDFEAGEITFNNPLVIDNDNLNWKQALSESYGGKTGKALSKAIIKDGFDGIVTVDGKSISEIVDLTTFDESKALFSASSTVTSNTNTRTVSRSNANEIVGRFLKGLSSAGKNYVSVVSTYDDLPTDIKDAAKAQGAEYQVKGVFHKGKVHVVLDQHTSALDMETTLFHEAYGHLGIKNLFGDDITKKLNSLFIANGGLKGLRETAKRHGINLEQYIKGLDGTNMPQEVKNRVLMDELLAHMQQSNKPSVKRLAREIVGFIRQKLRDLGLASLAKVSDSDLFYVLKQARAAARKGPIQNMDSQAQFSIIESSAQTDKQLEKELSNKNRKLLFHGSPHSFPKFSLNSIGTGEGAQAYGWGLYFSDSKEYAQKYKYLEVDNRVGESSMYQASIPSDLLLVDYFAPLDSQGKVTDALREITDNHFGQKVFDSWAENQDGGDFRDLKDNLLENISDKEISELLLEKGVQGLVYTTKTENFKDKNVKNYVVWDEGAINIHTRNGGNISDAPLFRTTDDAAPFSAPVENKWSKDWFKRKLQDKFAPIKDMQASIEKATGRELPEDQNAYRAEELFYGKTENDLNKMEKNHVKPLVDAMTSNNIDSAELDQFLIAKHARERNAHIASINPEMQDGGSGMTNAEADAILSRYEQEGKLRGLEAAASEVYKITQKRRELMRDAGLEDESLLDVWDATYEFYVPLKGYAEDSEGNSVAKTGSGFDIRGKESMRAMGRRTIAESPTAHAIQDLSATIIRSRKNEVGRTFLKMVEENPNPDIWEVFTEDNPDTERRIVNGEVKENQPIDMRSRKDDYFSVKVDGQSKYIKLKDKDGLLMKAMKNMGPEQMNTFTRSMSEVTRWLSMVNTSLNPEFTVTNFTRDIQTALFNALAEQDLTDGKVKDKAIAMKMIKGSGKAVKSLWQHSAGKLDETDPMYKWIEEFLSDGAKTGYFDSKEVDKIGTDLADLLDMANGTNKGKLLKAKHKIGDFIENVNGGIENGVRLSSYIEARKAGVTREKAASFAKNLTVNFNRKGEIGTFLNSLYMFFNAAVQGNANFARAIITPKVDEVTGKKSLNMAQKVAVGISLASFGWAALMREMAGDDEDGVPYWDKIPKGVRERNFIIPKTLWGGEPGEYVKIPLPYGYNIFYNLGDAAEAAINSDTRKSGDLAAEMALSVYASFVPLGSPVGDNGAESAALVASPTFFKPIVEIATNKNFFGGPIYRENNPYGPQLRDSQMSMRSTGGGYKWMASFMNDVIGDGRSYKVNGENPWYDVSPDSIEHLVEFSLGGLYRFGSRIYDNVAKSAQGGELESTDIPFARQLNGKVQPYADITQFYEARQQLKNIDAEMDSLRGKERLEFRKEYGDKLRLQGLMGTLDKRMKMLGKQRDRVEINESISFAEKQKKLQRIEDQMKSTAARFNKRWNEVN